MTGYLRYVDEDAREHVATVSRDNVTLDFVHDSLSTFNFKKKIPINGTILCFFFLYTPNGGINSLETKPKYNFTFKISWATTSNRSKTKTITQIFHPFIGKSRFQKVIFRFEL